MTGSVGKTTAKEMLRAMLAACGATHASAASYNNHWGVPLTLARMPADARFGVFEMGMNHAGEIAPLTRMARPHAALVTTIAPVHIEYLGSIEAIADAKAEIFLGLEPHGTAVLNRDAPQFERLAKAAAARGARVLSFGRGAECDARLLEVEATERGSRVRARVLGRELAFELGAPGAHMAENALGALLAAEALGADLDACAAALRGFSPQKGRGERFLLPTPDGPATIIDESYNANPASMRAALALLAAAKPGPKGRRIAVIGDMLELGPKAAAMHAELAADLSANKVDLLFGAGPLTRALFDAAPASMRAAWTERSSELDGRSRPDLARRRHRDGQRLERQPDGSAGRGSARPLRSTSGRLGHADLAGRAPGRFPPVPIPDFPHARRGGNRAFPRLLLRSGDHLRIASEAGRRAADPCRRTGLASSQARRARRPWAA